MNTKRCLKKIWNSLGLKEKATLVKITGICYTTVTYQNCLYTLEDILVSDLLKKSIITNMIEKDELDAVKAINPKFRW